ncbi:MAG: hypothetical protein H7343_19225 [Undibacterium sp.]|nr:hypothetical protein [Opitutaceae bacterium]
MRVSTLLTFLGFAFFSLAAHALAAAPVTVATAQNYRGWPDAIILRNATVEAIIVPSVGRVMQLRFVGETDGPFWENEKLAGLAMPTAPWTVAHGSFGGDKTWPAPQSDWKWPPPVAFDAAPHTAAIDPAGIVTLSSPLDPKSGLRSLRRISLDPTEPVMRIATTYEKISGGPATVSVWVITQLRDPVAVFMPVPEKSRFPTGTTQEWSVPEEFLRRENNWMRFTRNPAKSQKTGNDGASLVWAGTHQLLRITIPRVAGADYPDGGCSVEIYGNENPFPYVELETLGPLQALRPGETVTATTTYRLARRTPAPLEDDVRALLAPPSP